MKASFNYTIRHIQVLVSTLMLSSLDLTLVHFMLALLLRGAIMLLTPTLMEGMNP